MACETRTKVIDGENWSVTQMAATEALALETQLAPVLLQGLVPLLASPPDTDEAQAAALSRAVQAMTISMPPEQMAKIIKDLCSQCFYKGERVMFERDFSGGRGVMLRYRVAWFVLETNFSDFFAEMLPEGVMDRAKSMFAEKTQAAASTGGSGDRAPQSLHSAA